MAFVEPFDYYSRGMSPLHLEVQHCMGLNVVGSLHINSLAVEPLDEAALRLATNGYPFHCLRSAHSDTDCEPVASSTLMRVEPAFDLLQPASLEELRLCRV